jgi:hypothetical protein
MTTTSPNIARTAASVVLRQIAGQGLNAAERRRRDHERRGKLEI